MSLETPRPMPIVTFVGLCVPLFLLSSGLFAAEEWEAILQQAIGAEHSQTRHDGLKQVDTSTAKGLKALWKVLAIRDPHKVDWYVRKGAHDAILKASGEEAEKEIDRVLAGAEDELAREAIVWAIIEKIRKEIVKRYGENDDHKINEVEYKVRKLRGADYFEYVLDPIKAWDPEKKQLKRIQTAFADKSPRVKRAAIQGLLTYPDATSIPLLLDNLKKLEKQKAKSYREWVLTRNALETLTGQYFRENVEDWGRWWELMKKDFTIEKRIEEEKAKDDESRRGKTMVLKKDAVEVTVHMKIVGPPDGYPLLVLPEEGYEVDYMRPYFHGVEEFCKVYYVRMPRLEDYKGLARDPKSNTVNYPTAVLARALADIMKESEIEKCGVLGHGSEASTLAMMFTAENSSLVTHLVLINPWSSADVFNKCVDAIRRLGKQTGNKEMVKGADRRIIKEDGNPIYKETDDAEGGGMARATTNVSFSDPTEPETGSLREFFKIPSSTARMVDHSWSAKKIFAGKKTDFPVLIFMGEKDLWVQVSDMTTVAAQFKRPVIAKMPESALYPFISETYAFTRQLETFFKPAIQAKKAREEKEKKKDEKAAAKDAAKEAKEKQAKKEKGAKAD